MQKHSYWKTIWNKKILYRKQVFQIYILKFEAPTYCLTQSKHTNTKKDQFFIQVNHLNFLDISRQLLRRYRLNKTLPQINSLFLYCYALKSENIRFSSSSCSTLRITNTIPRPILAYLGLWTLTDPVGNTFIALQWQSSADNFHKVIISSQAPLPDFDLDLEWTQKSFLKIFSQLSEPIRVKLGRSI